MHRDLKPGNIMLSAKKPSPASPPAEVISPLTYTLKIIDLGMVKEW